MILSDWFHFRNVSRLTISTFFPLRTSLLESQQLIRVLSIISLLKLKQIITKKVVSKNRLHSDRWTARVRLVSCLRRVHDHDDDNDDHDEYVRTMTEVRCNRMLSKTHRDGSDYSTDCDNMFKWKENYSYSWIWSLQRILLRSISGEDSDRVDINIW